MAKYCSNCGKELDVNASICLSCGVVIENQTSNNNKKENKKGMPTWAIILIVIGCLIILPIILITIIGISAYSIIKDADIDIEEIIEETITQTGTIGDTLTADTFKITLTDALMYDSLGTNEFNKETPKEGKEYLVFFFDIENISNESEYISNYDFSGYVDGYSVSTKNTINDINGIEELGIDLAPGMKTKGFVAFEVDTTWQEFEIHFSDLFEASELIFKVVNEDKENNQGV